MKPILCLDFDGVIHSYTSGWTDITTIADRPVPGALNFIREAQKEFRVYVFSSRSNHPGGIDAMKAWFSEYTKGDPRGPITDLEFPTEKPPARVTLDDRAITFMGKWPSVQSLLDFKPWYK